eukprot:COSAG01_NODE_10240_length_2211_cov_1.671084_3_plen_174_part_00
MMRTGSRRRHRGGGRRPPPPGWSCPPPSAPSPGRSARTAGAARLRTLCVALFLLCSCFLLCSLFFCVPPPRSTDNRPAQLTEEGKPQAKLSGEPLGRAAGRRNRCGAPPIFRVWVSSEDTEPATEGAARSTAETAAGRSAVVALCAGTFHRRPQRLEDDLRGAAPEVDRPHRR